MARVQVRLFATAREAAGRADDVFEGDALATLGDVVAAAVARYGDEFSQVMPTARVWINGDEPREGHATNLRDGDEIAVLPPVSGG